MIEATIWLDAWLSGARVTRVEVLGSGVIAEVFGVTFNHAGEEKRAALRVLNEADDAGIARLYRTARLHERLVGAGLPVPEPYRIVEHGNQAGMWMEWMPGKTSQTPDLNAMAEMLRRIHSVSADDLGLDVWRPARLEVEQIPVENRPRGLDLEAVLSMVPQPPGHRVLLHGDFWPGNLLWDGSEITAVLDWEDAVMGHWLHDIVNAWFELRLAGRRVSIRHLTHAHGWQTYCGAEPELLVWQLYVLRKALLGMHRWGLSPIQHMRWKESIRSLGASALDRIDGTREPWLESVISDETDSEK